MKSKFIDGHYLPLPQDLIESAAFKVVPPAAMKILLAIGNEWVRNGLQGNGNLTVTYKMLRVATGIGSKTTLALNLKQLDALGLLAMNRGKWSVEIGRRECNKYRLPWLPGHNGGPPTKEYLEVQSEKHGKQLLEEFKEKRKDPKTRKMRVIVEFEDI